MKEKKRKKDGRVWLNGWLDRRRRKKGQLRKPPPAYGSEFPYKTQPTPQFVDSLATER